MRIPPGWRGSRIGETEAYVLAGELKRARGDVQTAFHHYETRLRSFVAQKQDAAIGLAGYFAPRTALGLFLRNVGTALASVPGLAGLLVGNSLRDDFETTSGSDTPEQNLRPLGSNRVRARMLQVLPSVRYDL